MKSLAPTALSAAVLAFAFVLPAHALSGGVASFYGPGFAGKKTANGERFNPGAMTAAHKSLPFGTRLKLTNTANGRSVVVRVNDRGPFVRGRVLDVSQGAARVLGFVASGTARLKIEHASGHAVTERHAPTRVRTVATQAPKATPMPQDERIAEREETNVDWRAKRLEEHMHNG